MGQGNEIVDGPEVDFYYYEGPFPPGILLDRVEIAVAEDNGLGQPGPFKVVFVWGDGLSNNGLLPNSYFPEEANKPIAAADLHATDGWTTGIGINIGNNDDKLYRFVRFQTYPNTVIPVTGELVEIDAVEAYRPSTPTPEPPTLVPVVTATPEPTTPIPTDVPTVELATPTPTTPVPTNMPTVELATPTSTTLAPTDIPTREPVVPRPTNTHTSEPITDIPTRELVTLAPTTPVPTATPTIATVVVTQPPTFTATPTNTPTATATQVSLIPTPERPTLPPTNTNPSPSNPTAPPTPIQVATRTPGGQPQAQPTASVQPATDKPALTPQTLTDTPIVQPIPTTNPPGAPTTVAVTPSRTTAPSPTVKPSSATVLAGPTTVVLADSPTTLPSTTTVTEATPGTSRTGEPAEPTTVGQSSTATATTEPTARPTSGSIGPGLPNKRKDSSDRTGPRTWEGWLYQLRGNFASSILMQGLMVLWVGFMVVSYFAYQLTSRLWPKKKMIYAIRVAAFTVNTVISWLMAAIIALAFPPIVQPIGILVISFILALFFCAICHFYVWFKFLPIYWLNQASGKDLSELPACVEYKKTKEDDLGSYIYQFRIKQGNYRSFNDIRRVASILPKKTGSENDTIDQMFIDWIKDCVEDKSYELFFDTFPRIFGSKRSADSQTLPVQPPLPTADSDTTPEPAPSITETNTPEMISTAGKPTPAKLANKYTTKSLSKDELAQNEIPQITPDEHMHGHNTENPSSPPA